MFHKKLEKHLNECLNIHSDLADSRYWNLWQRCVELENQYRQLLDYLDLEIIENPKTTIVKKKKGV
jgi:hypothetical protein